MQHLKVFQFFALLISCVFNEKLDIKKERLGLGWLYLMDLKQLYEIGMKVFKNDPMVTLCDDTGCAFCSKFKK